MPNQPSFPIDPPILRQGGHYDFPSNTRPFSYNVHYTPVPETRRPSITVPTWYPASMAVDDGRLDASSLGEQGWRNRPHQAMDFGGGDGGSIWGEGPIVETPTSPASPEPSFEWNGSDSPFGEPIVETPTDQNPLPLPPDEPLFADITNRNIEIPSEWLEEERQRTDESGSGPDLGNFGNNLTFGEFLNTPLWQMNYGSGYHRSPGGANPSIDLSGGGTNWNSSRNQWERLNLNTGQFERVDGPRDPFLGNNSTGIPVEPGVLNQNVEGDQVGGGYSSETSGGPSQMPGETGSITPDTTGHWDFTRGEYVQNNNATGAQFRDNNPHFGAGALTAMLQWSQGYGGAPNRTLVNDNERVFASAHGPNRPAPPRPPTGGG